MAVGDRKRPAPAAGSTPRANPAARGRRASSISCNDDVQPEAVCVHPTTATPATADGQRHRNHATRLCTLEEAPAAAAAVGARVGIDEMVPAALELPAEAQAEAPAAAGTGEGIEAPKKPQPAVSAAELRARAETWDWAGTDTPVPPDTRRVAERATVGLLMRASEAVELLYAAGHSYIQNDSSAFLSRLVTWLVADALGCKLPDQDAAFAKGKAVRNYVKAQMVRIADIEKHARKRAARAAEDGSERAAIQAATQVQLDEFLAADSTHANAPEFTRASESAEESSEDEEAKEDRAELAASTAATAARVANLEAAPKLLTLRPAPRLESYTKEISADVEDELNEAGHEPPLRGHSPDPALYVRRTVSAHELVEYSYGDAEQRRSMLSTFAEFERWDAVEKELRPVTTLDYPEMLVEMYHRARHTELELTRERKMFERMYDLSQAREHKEAHEFYGGFLLSEVAAAKKRLQQSHEAEMARWDRFAARWPEFQHFMSELEEDSTAS